MLSGLPNGRRRSIPVTFRLSGQFSSVKSIRPYVILNRIDDLNHAVISCGLTLIQLDHHEYWNENRRCLRKSVRIS